MYVFIAAGVILAVLIIGAKLLLPGPQSGTAGESREVGEEFVVLDYGYKGDEVTFLVIRNWPRSSPASDRAADDRFDLMGLPPTYRDSNGSRQPLSVTPHVYFFDGSQLTSFPVEMSEDDLDDITAALDGNGLTDYRKLLPLIRRFEVSAP